MNYLKINMEIIKKNRPYMYQMLKESEIVNISDQISEIKSVLTKDNSKSLYINVEGKNYRFNSIYSPTNEARIWASQFEFKNLQCLLSLFGLGNGEFARGLLNIIRENDKLVIYEPSMKIFYHVINNYDITDILSHPRVSLSVEGINDFEFHNSLQTILNIDNISNQIMCTHPFYDKLFPESGIKFYKELKDCYINAKTNINTEIAFGKRFIDNILHNIRYLPNSISFNELKEILPKNVPVMVIAAGPSVANQIEDIRRAKRKAIIFAVDRILELLLDNDIIPDFVVTLDAMKPVKYFSERTDVTIPLLCFMQSNKDIMDRHKGKKIIVNCSEFLEPIYTNVNKIPPKILSSASVATLACLICVEMGYKDIILVGQDLAYDGEKSHSGKEEEINNTNRDVILEDIDGNSIRSRYDWKAFKIWYEDLIVLRPSLNIIDAKTKGAKINGAIVMPLTQAVDNYCKKEFGYSVLTQIDINTFDKEGIISIKNYLYKNCSNIDKIIKKAKKSIFYCNILINELKSKNSKSNLEMQYVHQLSRNNEYIQNSSIYDLIDIYVKAISMQDILEINKLSNDDLEYSINTYIKTKKINEAIIEAAKYIKPRLEEAISSLHE